MAFKEKPVRAPNVYGPNIVNYKPEGAQDIVVYVDVPDSVLTSKSKRYLNRWIRMEKADLFGQANINDVDCTFRIPTPYAKGLEFEKNFKDIPEGRSFVMATFTWHVKKPKGKTLTVVSK